MFTFIAFVVVDTERRLGLVHVHCLRRRSHMLLINRSRACRDLSPYLRNTHLNPQPRQHRPKLIKANIPTPIRIKLLKNILGIHLRQIRNHLTIPAPFLPTSPAFIVTHVTIPISHNRTLTSSSVIRSTITTPPYIWSQTTTRNAAGAGTWVEAFRGGALDSGELVVPQQGGSLTKQ